MDHSAGLEVESKAWVCKNGESMLFLSVEILSLTTSSLAFDLGYLGYPGIFLGNGPWRLKSSQNVAFCGCGHGGARVARIS